MNQVVSPDTTPAAPSGAARKHSRREARAIQNSLPILARQAGRRADVEVIIGPYHPHRVGKKIFIPVLPLEDPELEIVAFGYTLHEAAHLRNDGPTVVKSPLHDRLRNALQDPVDERLLGREFPGYAHRFRQLMSKLVKDNILEAPNAEDSPLEKLEKYMLYRLRATMLEQEALVDYAKRAEELARAAFPPGVCTKIGSIIGRVPRLRTRQQVADLVMEVLDVLEEESQEPPPPAPPPPADGQGDPADGPQGQAQGEAAPSPSAQGEPSGSGDGGNAPAMTDPSASADGSHSAPGSPEDPGTDSHGTAAQRENLRQVLQTPEGSFGPDFGQVLGDLLESSASDAAVAGLSAGLGRATTRLEIPDIDPAPIMEDAKSATIALRSRLASLVEATRSVRDRHGVNGAQIDPRRLVASQLGETKLFKRRRSRVEVNTDVKILLDRSGSMSDRLQTGVRTVLAAAMALEAIRGVTVSTAAFPGCDADVELLTKAGETVQRTVRRYSAVTAAGGTPLAPALLWAVDELLAGPGNRKILLVVTDGRPAQEALCQDIIGRCWRGGIEACGIGILVPDITELFPVSRSITTLQELAPAIFGVLQESLTRRAAA
jgi:cobaltochelatase CobT